MEAYSQQIFVETREKLANEEFDTNVAGSKMRENVCRWCNVKNKSTYIKQILCVMFVHSPCSNMP